MCIGVHSSVLADMCCGLRQRDSPHPSPASGHQPSPGACCLTKRSCDGGLRRAGGQTSDLGRLLLTSPASLSTRVTSCGRDRISPLTFDSALGASFLSQSLKPSALLTTSIVLPHDANHRTEILHLKKHFGKTLFPVSQILRLQ